MFFFDSVFAMLSSFYETLFDKTKRDKASGIHGIRIKNRHFIKADIQNFVHPRPLIRSRRAVYDRDGLRIIQEDDAGERFTIYQRPGSNFGLPSETIRFPSEVVIKAVAQKTA